MTKWKIVYTQYGVMGTEEFEVAFPIDPQIGDHVSFAGKCSGKVIKRHISDDPEKPPVLHVFNYPPR